MRIICIRLSEFFSSEPTQIWDPRLLRLARDVPKSGLQLAPSSTIFEPSLNAGIFLKNVVLKVGTLFMLIVIMSLNIQTMPKRSVTTLTILFIYLTQTPLIGSCFSLLSPLFSLSPMILYVNAKKKHQYIRSMNKKLRSMNKKTQKYEQENSEV